jgi:hypothetical protein
VVGRVTAGSLVEHGALHAPAEAVGARAVEDLAGGARDH